jgi:hypothetical protein
VVVCEQAGYLTLLERKPMPMPSATVIARFKLSGHGGACDLVEASKGGIPPQVDEGFVSYDVVDVDRCPDHPAP